MKINLSIILSLVALIGVVVLAIVMACLNISLANVSLDTFIGVMVTMIGILVTFAVGWQIINALEIKSKLAEIEKRCAEFIENNTPLKRTKRVLGKVLKNNTPPPKDEKTLDITCAVKRPVLFKRTVLI